VIAVSLDEYYMRHDLIFYFVGTNEGFEVADKPYRPQKQRYGAKFTQTG
jgi:hypothetical protein